MFSRLHRILLAFGLGAPPTSAAPATLDAYQRALSALARNEALEALAELAEGTGTPGRLAALRTKYAELRARTQAARYDGSADFPLAYHPQELEAARHVMHDFGPLFVDPYDIANAPADEWETAGATPTPWAGYWYPLRGTQLFEGDDAPLAKLDRLLNERGQESHAAAWERAKQKNAPVDAWEGLCGAWAFAASMTPEPAAPRTVGSVTFTVSDQKALLTKLYEAFPSQRYGVRYLGDASTDGTYQDLRPEAFHRLATVLLGERAQPFVVDIDPGVEVWQRPFFRLQWRMTVDPSVPNSVRVTAKALSVGSRNAVTEAPTGTSDVTSTTYSYRLYFDPRRPLHGKYPVIAGEWLGDSISAHPDFVVLPQAAGRRRSGNPEINAHMAAVESLLGLSPRNPRLDGLVGRL